MAGFSTDYSEVKEGYALVPEGEYEVVIRNIEERSTQKGSTGLNLSLVVRNDVNQNCKDRYIFHTLWKRKEPTQADMQVQGYSFKQLMSLAKAVNLPSGKSYETVQQLCADMLKRPLRITVVHGEWDGKVRAEVRYTNASNFPDCKHVFKEKQQTATTTAAATTPPPVPTVTIGDVGEFEEILSDGDVPF